MRSKSLTIPLRDLPDPITLLISLTTLSTRDLACASLSAQAPDGATAVKVAAETAKTGIRVPTHMKFAESRKGKPSLFEQAIERFKN